MKSLDSYFSSTASMATAAFALLAALSIFSCATAFAEERNNSKTTITYLDNDANKKDSPGDEIEMSNGLIYLKFRFVGLSTDKRKADEKYNGYYLDTVKYRGETCFSHPDWKTESSLYPYLSTNDVVGMTAFVMDKTYRDEPFLWMWNAKEPAKSISTNAQYFPPNAALQAYEFYTYYEKHEARGDELVFSSGKSARRTEELSFKLAGPNIKLLYTVENVQQDKSISNVGIVVFPANRIIDTVFTPPESKATRKIPPTAFSDNYTFTIENADGKAGTGMLFWSRAEDALLHMDGMFTWKSMKIGPREKAVSGMTIAFHDKNISDFYLDYLKSRNIEFDAIDWDEVEKYLISKLPLVVMDEGWIYHAYDYNPPGTNHDWHNEMTGRAFIVQYLQDGDPKWLEMTKKADKYYLDRMYYNDPNHVCYGYFRDQSHSDKLRDCYLWSQPYNVESLIAEYAITKDENIKKVLLLNFEKVYGGPLYNKDAKRWYWVQTQEGKKSDFGTFDAQEFGVDVMVSAYEFTGEKKYLDRALEVMNGQKRVLENFGLLLEDRAGEPSVNTFAFAAKILFKLYEYTGDAYWLDRGIKILDATVFSRVFMEPYTPEDRWLNGALARKDGDWKGQHGDPTTGTDSSAPSQSSYIPWVMEALVAGYNHTGNQVYINYIAQMLHHQLELNKRMAAASGGKAELCGHYNMYLQKFDKDNDGLTVVSNLFLFPYVKVFGKGVRSPHSSIVLLPSRIESSVRAYHLSGIDEEVSMIIPGVAASVKETDIAGANGKEVLFKTSDGGISFKAAPYSMYEIKLK